jgi:hypothetical protein
MPAAAALLSACTVTSVGAKNGPPRIESDGLIQGHAAFGFRDEPKFLSLELLDGTSDGALAELSIWKLFRLEVGALGLGVGIGPIDLALGTLFYDADVPRMTREASAERAESPEGSADESAASSTGSEADCELCRRAREGSSQP